MISEKEFNELELEDQIRLRNFWRIRAKAEPECFQISQQLEMMEVNTPK